MSIARVIISSFFIVVAYGVFATFKLSFELVTSSRDFLAIGAGLFGISVVIGLILWCGRPISSAFCTIGEASAKITRVSWIIGCIACGIALRISWFLAVPTVPRSDGAIYLSLAKGLVDRGEYVISGTYAYWPPGLPLSLVPTLIVFGDRAWVPHVNNLVWFTISILVVYWLGRALSGEAVAKAATLLLAFWPNLIFLSGYPAKELFLAALLPLALACYLHATRTDTANRAIGYSLAAGVALGCAVLTQPSLIPFPTAFLVFEATRRDPLVIRAKRLLLLIFATAVVVSPWTVRNYLVLDAFVPVSSTGGVSLYVGNNPDATGGHVKVSPAFFGEEYDEVTKNALALENALQWISENPSRFLGLALRKQTLLLGDDGNGAYETMKRGKNISDIWYILFKGISNIYWLFILGLLVLVASIHFNSTLMRNDDIILLMLPLLYVFVLHSVFESGSRHHIAMAGCLAVIAAHAFVRSEEVIPSRSSRSA